MHMLVRHIDFADRVLTIELAGAVSTRDLSRLNRYLNDCLGLQFFEIRLCHDGDPVDTSPWLDQSVTKCQAKVISLRPEDLPDDIGNGRFRCRKLTTRRGKKNPYAEYNLHFTDFAKAMDEFYEFIMLVGQADPLEQATLMHLRLCLTELIMNTIDHGKFTNEKREADITLVFHKEWVRAVYKDNAESFHTAKPLDLDVDEKISDGTKRGFGLFILNRIAEDLDYKRVNDQNCTEFKILRDNKVFSET